MKLNRFNIICITIVLVFSSIASIDSKIFDRYELAIELYRGNLTSINVWICILNKISGYQTDLLHGGAGDRTYGMFQFYEPFWCEHGRPGRGCKMDCTTFLDEDIANDIECAKIVYDTEGISAWEKYAKDCFPHITYTLNDCELDARK